MIVAGQSTIVARSALYRMAPLIVQNDGWLAVFGVSPMQYWTQGRDAQRQQQSARGESPHHSRHSEHPSHVTSLNRAAV